MMENIKKYVEYKLNLPEGHDHSEEKLMDMYQKRL